LVIVGIKGIFKDSIIEKLFLRAMLFMCAVSVFAAL
jgi:hypothetical protein